MEQQNVSGYGSIKEYRDDPTMGREYRDTQGGSTNFNGDCEKISDSIFQINNAANSIDRAMKIIGTERDSPQVRAKIHSTSQETHKLVSDVTRLMKKMSSTRGLDRPKKLKLDKLTSDFKTSVRRFTTLQKDAAEKVKSSVKLGVDRPPLVKKSGWLDDESDHTLLMEQEKRQQDLQEQEQVIEDDLLLIREREEQIQQLEADILDVNEIFKDLGTMIHEQGEVIDHIEQHMETTAANVEQGTQQLSKASNYQRKSRKKMCILIVILLIVAAIIAIIIATTVK
ncbi:hypothetical protein ScPMuIL_016109 [Solemya velum]